MNILYLVFGENQQNHAQAYFSICSFLGQMNAHDRVYVMTDAPDFYERLNKKIEILTIDKKQLDDWQGTHQFFWRAKIKAIEHICRLHPEESVLYLDTDTFLYSDIKILKSDLENPVMHLNEGALSKLKSKTEKLMWTQIGEKTFGGILIQSHHAMWNAGVVGIPAHKGLKICQLTLDICDDMLAANVTRRLIEQFALSVALSENGEMKSAENYIGHYWSNKDEWSVAIQIFIINSSLKNNSLEADVQAIKQFDFSKIAIFKRIPNTQKRLKKLIEKWFPSEDKAFITSKNYIKSPIS
jgi:hypothetical protein